VTGSLLELWKKFKIRILEGTRSEKFNFGSLGGTRQNQACYCSYNQFRFHSVLGFKTITDIPTGGADAAKELGGHYIARGGKITPLDGSAPPQRFIAYAFDSVEKAQAFNNSEYFKKVSAIRNKTTEARAFIVEGMSQ
jgi:uncharacterized protein (DUF1330 family)